MRSVPLVLPCIIRVVADRNPDLALSVCHLGQMFELRPLKLEDFFELAGEGGGGARETTNSGEDYLLNLD